MRQQILDAARPNLFRIIGPNTLGLMIPPLRLNAGFAHMPARPGKIALVSQSGAIVTTLIDWAADNNVGFSQIVSLGDMADVDVGDYLDLLAGDPETRAIVLYLETITNPRKFMSAARAAARIKPVIAVKSGRHAAAAKAAATHTGALAGADRVVEAALHRAGILRVKGLAELFDAAETTATFAPLDRARVAVVTNGGGAGVLQVDELLDRSAELAQFSDATLSRLDTALPPTWSRANPADIIGDAPPDRYVAAIEAVADDDGADVVLVLNCPTALASPSDAATAVAGLAKDGRVGSKPLLTCWLGERTAREGRRILQDGGVASFETPADAAAAVAHLSAWSQAQHALMRVPSSRSEDCTSDPEAVRAIFRWAATDARRMLTEPEAKAAIAAYGIAVPETIVATTAAEARAAAARLLENTEAVVVKLLSNAVSHKSDVGGVVLNIASAAAAEDAAASIAERVRARKPQADVQGFAVQPMVVRKQAQELILGMSRDPIFGPVILFGAGGVAVEVMDDTAVALPPLDDVLARDLVARTRIGRLLAGFRDRRPSNQVAIAAALNGLSQMIVDFPCIVAIDINPLLADDTGVIALDARIEIEPETIDTPGPNPGLAIRPYPAEWDRRITLVGTEYRLRPIKPIDIELYPDFLAKVSPGDVRLRFLAPHKAFPDDMLKRLTQLDYDRDMAFVALDTRSGALAGIGRLSSDPDRTVAEYGLLVRSDLQGHGLGWALLQQIIDFARTEGIARIEGFILAENSRMLTMCREFGFEITLDGASAGTAIARLAMASE